MKNTILAAFAALMLCAGIGCKGQTAASPTTQGPGSDAGDTDHKPDDPRPEPDHKPDPEPDHKPDETSAAPMPEPIPDHKPSDDTEPGGGSAKE